MSTNSVTSVAVGFPSDAGTVLKPHPIPGKNKEPYPFWLGGTYTVYYSGTKLTAVG